VENYFQKLFRLFTYLLRFLLLGLENVNFFIVNSKEIFAFNSCKIYYSCFTNLENLVILAVMLRVKRRQSGMNRIRTIIRKRGNIRSCPFLTKQYIIFSCHIIYVIKQDIHIYVPSSRQNGWTRWAEIFCGHSWVNIFYY